MDRGIYFMANDAVTEHVIAFLNSVRRWDKDIPICFIPYDGNYKRAERIAGKYGAFLFPDLGKLEDISRSIQGLFPKNHFARPNQFRKQVAWVGPFERFVYIDTDVVVFNSFKNQLEKLRDVDFLCDDYQHTTGIRDIFTEEALTSGILSTEECGQIFNAGFWGARNDLFTRDQLIDRFQECAKASPYFDYRKKTSDMPAFNYLVIKFLQRKLNLTSQGPDGRGPGSWAGTKGFRFSDERLFDERGAPLSYLHWAGMKISPQSPYWEVWRHYRFLSSGKLEETLSLFNLEKARWRGQLSRLVRSLQKSRVDDET